MTNEQLVSLYLPYPGRGERILRVFVPAHEDGQLLPVIYMTDGQNLFDVENSGFGCWYTREAVRDERQRSGKAAILVGIHNVDPWRTNELLPKGIGEIHVPEEARPYFDPQGEVFDEFLVKTVMPAVEERFPVRTGREHTAFCGSSMGGLFAFFTALRHPELFCCAGVLSPAFLFYRDEDLVGWLRSVLQEQKPFLYFFSGGSDDLERQICEKMRRFLTQLDELYPKEKIKTVIQPEQRHHETAWEPIFRDLLRLLLNH